MRRTSLLACLLPGSLFITLPATAIESQALGIVEVLPIQVRQVLECGRWVEGDSQGYYRIVLVAVDSGAGTEVYLQRVQEVLDHQGLQARLRQTIPVRELNDDHAQYQVRSATCATARLGSSVELMATFEHDVGNVERRIRILLGSSGSYSMKNTIVRASGRP